MDFFSSYEISISSEGFSISNLFREVTNKSCKSIYFRKPVQENLIDIYEEKYHQFSYRESYSLIEGLAEYFPGKCLSRPSAMRRSGNKVFQALTAHEVGFKIPTLSITNSIKSVEKISRNKSIVKPLSVGSINDRRHKEYVQTNLYDEQYELSLLKYTPAYFQHYINKDYEVRITFVGKKHFSVRIDSEDSVDWRKAGNKIKYSTCEIPESIYNNCLSYLGKTKMEFGCFDFIVLKGEWYFLEMNSNGQWAWLEFETGLPISKEIVGYLNE
jgi:glutathione synthase/RimK-type ligase-like ATP-grasp enzyme